jgi:phosphorylcholine metabolism protein LicD
VKERSYMSGKKELRGRYLKTALRMLNRVTGILERNEIVYWLESGTLLGIIRDNRLLPWDSDLDLAIKEEDAAKLISILYKFWFWGNKTYITRHHLDTKPFTKGDPRIIKIFNSVFGNVLIDIFVKRKYGDRYYWAIGGKKKNTIKSAPAHFYENIWAYNFNGKELCVPSHYEVYLTYRYGDWRTPTRKWDVYKDDGAIINKCRSVT